MNRESNQIVAIGGDLGGTSIRLAFVGPDGRLTHLCRFPMPPQGEADAVVATLMQGIQSLSQKAEAEELSLVALGLGVAGLTDVESGVIFHSPNLPGMNRLPLRALLEEAGVRVPIFLENDANAAAFAERWVGAGRGARSVISLTLGTGIGSGIILDGKIWRGTSGLGGEAGHLAVEAEGEPCGCGSTGCVEAYVSATGIVREAQRQIAAGAGGLLARFTGRGDGLTAKDVYELAESGDSVAEQILRRAGRYLGVALASLVNVLNPEVITIGGGVAQAGKFLLEPVREEVRRRAFPVLAQSTRIVLSEMGDVAGMIGAAGIALEKLGYLKLSVE